MAAAHSWHPGSNCLNPAWVLPVPLLPGELFSSWLARAALEQGCDPMVLTGCVWPGWRIWTIDPDRGFGQGILNPIAKASGIGESAFEAATLYPTAEVVAGGHVGNWAIWPWMLAFGSRGRKHHGGLQYCPACLAKDRKPYYRVQWRFAWHTACSTHGCGLLDSCPQCGASVEPHRLTALDGHVAVCASCKSDLREASSQDTPRWAVAFQKAADETVLRMEGFYGKEHLGPAEWFSLARYFVGLLRKAADHPGNLAELIQALGVDIARLRAPATGLALEILPVAERAALLSATQQILAAGTDEFLGATRNGSTARAGVPGRVLQVCLGEITGEWPKRTIASNRKRRQASLAPCSRMAVMRKWARLQRKMSVTTR